MSLFSVKKCNYTNKSVEKVQKSPWIQEAASNTYPSFQSESVIIGKNVKKAPKFPWIHEVVSNTYPYFQSECVFRGKKRRKSPHG